MTIYLRNLSMIGIRNLAIERNRHQKALRSKSLNFRQHSSKISPLRVAPVEMTIFLRESDLRSYLSAPSLSKLRKSLRYAALTMETASFLAVILSKVLLWRV